MKKLLLLTGIAVTTFMAATAQNKSMIRGTGLQFDFQPAVAIPVAAFGATDLTANPDAGLAKTGTFLQMGIALPLKNNYAIVLDLLYGYHALNDAIFHQAGASSDHWQYAGALIGPAMYLDAGKHWQLDIRTLGGFTTVNSPAVLMNGSTLVKEDWAGAFTLQLGGNARYFFNSHVYAATGVGYTFMRPKFTVAAADGSMSETAVQKIDVISISAGIGYAF